MNIYKKVILTILTCVVIIFVYFYKYQQVINEGTVLAEEYCLQVEPIIDNKREQALTYIQSLLYHTKPEVLQVTSSNLINSLVETIDISTFWLQEQKNYMNRWDFNLLMSKEAKNVFRARYDVYENDLVLDKLSVEYLVNFEDTTIAQKFQDILKKSKQRYATYEEKYNIASKHFDIRNFFVKIPPSKCYFKRQMQNSSSETL